MNRSRFLAGATACATLVGVVMLAACARPPEPEPVALPSGTVLMVESTYVGGFVPPGYALVDPPRLAVYSDGRAVANASRTLTLSLTELADLVTATRRDLGGLGPTVHAGAEDRVADASTSVLKVLEADGQLRSVSAYALGIVSGYPPGLVAADTRLATLARRVIQDGTPFTAPRILLVAQEFNGDASQPVRDWPSAVPVPPMVSQDLTTRRSVLTGDEMAALLAVVPRDVSAGVAWPVLRTSSGLLLGVAWRYLLPHE